MVTCQNVTVHHGLHLELNASYGMAQQIGHTNLGGKFQFAITVGCITLRRVGWFFQLIYLRYFGKLHVSDCNPEGRL